MSRDSSPRRYRWISRGDATSPVVALIAPSNCFYNQRIIKDQIDVLVKNGFYVRYPVYEVDGKESLLADPRLLSTESFIAESYSPAVSPEDGALQIIEAIESGWNIMPLMGGQSFSDKIPLIVDYFSKHPELKNPRVKFFGYSNSSYATYLMFEEICTYIASPTTSAIVRFDFRKDMKYQTQATDLLALLRGEKSTVVRSLSGQVAGEKDFEVMHYPMNISPFIVSEKSRDFHKKYFSPVGDYSVEFEDFLENSIGMASWRDYLRNFFELHADNLPKFVVCGVIATRIDGAGGYNNLVYDKDGHIESSPDNISAMLKGKTGIAEQLKKYGFLPELHDKDLDSQDIQKIIQHENLQIINLRRDLAEIAKEYKVEFLTSNDFGHIKNMTIVPGGKVHCHVQEGRVVMSCNLSKLNGDLQGAISKAVSSDLVDKASVSAL